MLADERFTTLGSDLRICRILNGMWQVSGAHGAIDPAAALAAMRRYHDAGFTTWDLADHYGPAEDFVGQFRQELADDADSMVALTKWVPRPGPMTRPTVQQAIERSLRRMGTESLDLLQFHWWVYRDEGYLDALKQMADMRAEGSIRQLGLTNFDTQHVARIIDAGIPVVSNQVQYSLIDRRPEVRMAPYCSEHGVGLLAYGALCGGLISEAYLDRPEPGHWELSTASLQKYKQMVDAWGGWPRFQTLLATVKQVADKHGVTMANVATRFILERPAVAGVILGARLGVSDHFTENAGIFGWMLDTDDTAMLEAASSQGNNLFASIGDCGDEYR